MFTGIIETMSMVITNKDSHLVIERPKVFDDIAIGSSICIAGVCLTIVDLKEKIMSFDTVPETLRRTTLGEKKKGTKVNLERALKADGRFEGHVVQGHVEAVGKLKMKNARPDDVRIGREKCKMYTFTMPHKLLPFVVEKGSIAIDGVSLTVAGLKGDECTVALIPHTLKITTLGLLKEGDSVNLETDILGRYIRQC